MIIQRDINSAYPYACTKLPCLIHGQWRQTWKPESRSVAEPQGSNDREGGWYVGEFRFAHHRKRNLCGLPVRRRDGSICWPRHGEGVYWSVEVEAARRAGADVVLLQRAWEYVCACDCQPFAFIGEVYRERVKVGKSGRGYVLKTGLNSIYGKLCQSVGAAPYANPIWAGLITAITRAALIDDYIAMGEDDCVMLATDGVFYQKDDDYEDVAGGLGLGEWDTVRHEGGMFIIQPGLYFLADELGRPKTRGVPQSQVVESRETFENVWAGYLDTGILLDIDVPLRSFIGLRLALARNDPRSAGSWIEMEKAISFAWATKRDSSGTRLVAESGIRTQPRYGGARSVPYSRDIGGNRQRELERMEQDGQPDWAGTLRVNREDWQDDQSL